MPVEQLMILQERLMEKDRGLTLEINLITAGIKEHRESMPPRVEAPSSSPNKRNEYHEWRKISCRLHQRRAALKTQRDKIQTHLLALSRHMEEMTADFSNFPVFLEMDLETELTQADACA